MLHGRSINPKKGIQTQQTIYEPTNLALINLQEKIFINEVGY